MRFVLARVHALWCAVAIEHVAEVARPRPLTHIADAPDFVVGLTTLRDQLVPVLDLGRLLVGEPVRATRLLRLRIPSRRAALAVEEVAGVADIAPEMLQPLPSLLSGAPEERIVALGQRDAQVLAVLEAARLASSITLDGRRVTT
jgi:purine-binding chemotaxis protein CheW